MKKSTLRTPAQLQQWLESKTWERVWPWDRQDACKARQSLISLHFFQTKKISGDPAHDAEEQACRAALPLMVEKLSREDVCAVYELVRVLSLTPELVDEAIGNSARVAGLQATWGQLVPREKKLLLAVGETVASGD